ncbi:BZ3500_MvSof-1268-A1-R1_Chr3-3g06582 [Microbotryum saponariae]|uniref:BZ3500_MvSof-1268-A1-R1_Chr3-3g06582 protein n=1 Tax=Microbotryum saponariae TaxID=289078 RepID=A0A2X0N0M2_9BASI|nr:BZ3500_MvSof-1268-A1-R1_Chr3-3g06582 [Microbotryum saponariae]
MRILRRDVSTGNIMVRPDGEDVFIDYDLAIFMDGLSGEEARTCRVELLEPHLSLEAGLHHLIVTVETYCGLSLSLFDYDHKVAEEECIEKVRGSGELSHDHLILKICFSRLFRGERNDHNICLGVDRSLNFVFY